MFEYAENMIGGISMNDQSSTLKIKRYSRNLRIAMTIFFWVAILATIVSSIATIIMASLSDSHFVLNSTSIGHAGFSLDGLIKYQLNDTSLIGTNMKSIYIAISIMAAVISFFAIPVLRQFVLILKSVEDDKPFAKENAKRISAISSTLILSSFAIPATKAFVARALVDILKIQNVSINYSINITLLLTGFMMFILSGVFRYGCYLQQEYDETV